jgi:hypothetical protein
MDDGKIDRWVAAAGFGTLAAILILEGLVVYRLEMESMTFETSVIERSETIMRILFGRTR